MTRVEKITRAHELRATGLLEREIADRLGVHQATVSVWLNPPPVEHVVYERSTVGLAAVLENSTPAVTAGLPPRPTRLRLPRIPRFLSQSHFPLSLDAEISSRFKRGHATPLHEIVADPDPRSDPFDLVAGTLDDEVREVLGDMDIEDVASLNEWELERLRDRLVEVGVRRGRVTETERAKVVKTERSHSSAKSYWAEEAEMLGGSDLESTRKLREEAFELDGRPWESRSQARRRRKHRNRRERERESSRRFVAGSASSDWRR